MLYADWMIDAGAPPGTVPVAPPWLKGPNGQRWLRGIGQSLDANVDRCRQAIKASFPALAPSDALPVLGDEISMPRGMVETEDAYRARLAAAWTIWPFAGTAFGLLMSMYYAGYQHAVVQTQGGKQYQLAPELTGDPAHDLVVSQMATPVHLGGTPAELWSDFAVFIAKPWPSWWGAGAPADGSNDQKSLAALIKTWKAAHTRCVQLKVIDGPVVGLNITVGATFTVGFGSVTTWTPPAG